VGWDKTVIIGRYKYEINENNEIKIWDLENPNEFDAPFLHQPFNPAAGSWASKEEAEEWVTNKINELLNPVISEEVVEPVVE